MTPLNPSSFMTFLYIRPAWFFFISPQSPSIVFFFSSSQTSLSHSKPQTQVFFSLKEHFLLLVCLFFIHSSCISHFLPNFWVSDENLGFSKLLGFSHYFWVGFCENDFKSSCIASHLHFNYIFMHFRCVITMLNCCVLVGLDWIEPMMYLSLHVTCSCIFHAYVPLILYILIYWCCLVLFCSLFLPLSLFLLLVYSMAPKCKSTPSENPLYSWASTSSSNPTPSHVRFCNNKAQKDFSRRGIHSEC